MSRAAEGSLVLLAALLAAMGVALVNFTRAVGVDARVIITLAAFAVSFGSVHLAVRRFAPGSSPYLIPLVAFVAAVGFAEVYRLDAELAATQLWWLVISAAIAVMVLAWLHVTTTQVLRRYRYVFLVVGLGLLLLPLLPESWPLHGAEVNGSRLWVRLELPLADRSISFQPGEIAKLAIVVFLASYLADRHRALSAMTRSVGPIHLPEPRQLLPVLLAAVGSFAVLIYQRDLGAGLLLFAIFVGMLYMATARHSYLFAAGLIVIGGGFAANSAFSHVQERVDAWLRPFDDFLGTGYQVAQSLFALGSGSLTGSGLGVGRPDLIPAASTDFIYAAVAEETGLAGALAVLIAYALITAAGFGIALRARDPFRKLLAAGLTLAFAVQSILIMAGVLRLFPVTGITLPFMSYGGSSLLANMILVALLLRVSHEEFA